MARKPMVTRTIKVTTITVLCLDIETTDTLYLPVKITGTVRESNYLKIAKEQLETETLKCVHIHDIQEDSNLYGMDEIDFINNATILPPRK